MQLAVAEPNDKMLSRNINIEKADSARNLFSLNQAPLIDSQLDANLDLPKKAISIPIVTPNGNFKDSSDKHIENKNTTWNNWMKLIHKMDKYACFSNIIFNVFGAFTMLTSIPAPLKKNIEKFVGFITNLSYVPYGISGGNQGVDKKNPLQAIGFFAEAILPWFGNLKDIYLLRGLSAGVDQVWEYADRNLPAKYGKGFFPDYMTGLKETFKACYKLLKEIAQDPLKTIFPVKFDKSSKSWKFESKGHNGLLSTIFDVIASVGYMLTGKEKLFGPMRDLASWLFDVELAFQDKLAKKASGLLFIMEGVLDFVARYLNKNQDMRLFVNMLAHASGRSALMLYKNSCASAQKIANSDK